MRLNKAFTIEIERLLSMLARIAQQNQASIRPCRRTACAVSGRGSVKRSNTCAVWLGGGGAPAGVGPQSVLTVCVKGCRTRSVNMDWNDARVAGGAGSCSLAFANACVVPAVSGPGLGRRWARDRCRRARYVGRGEPCDLRLRHRLDQWRRCHGLCGRQRRRRRGRRGARALATFVVPPSGAKATARAVSKSLVSLL